MFVSDLSVSLTREDSRLVCVVFLAEILWEDLKGRIGGKLCLVNVSQCLWLLWLIGLGRLGCVLRVANVLDGLNENCSNSLRDILKFGFTFRVILRNKEQFSLIIFPFNISAIGIDVTFSNNYC